VAAVAPKVVLAGRYAEVRLGDERWFAPGDPRALGRRIFAVTVDGRDVLEEVVGAGVHRVETAAGITNEPGEGAGEPGGRWRWTTGPDPFYVPVPDGRFEVAVDGEPVSVSAPLTLINTVGCYLRDDGYAGDVGLEEPDDGRHATVCERFALSGVALAATADTWRRVGPLARPLFAYYEDIDWSWRARRLGLRLRYDPSASVVHHRSATSGGVASARVRFLAERNRLLCLVRNAPWSVASKALRRRVAEGPGYGVRRATGALLPWALATRSRITRRAVLDAAEVWERWAGVDVPRDAAPGA
jgi:GT2 family glycosyltransferase